MRLLLLLALLLHFALTPVLAHCGGEEPAVPVATHAYHAEDAAEDLAGDCSHCPSSECPEQQGCAAGVGTLAVPPMASADFGFPVTRQVSRDVSMWQSVAPTPPVPPPVIHSA